MSGWRKRQIMEVGMYTLDEFEALMNETYPLVKFGEYSYGRGTVLRKVDPEAFMNAHIDWVAYMDECAEDRVN